MTDMRGVILKGRWEAVQLHRQFDMRERIEQDGGRIEVFGTIIKCGVPLVWRRDFAKPRSKLGFPKILSSIVGGMITAQILKRTGNLAAVMRTMGHKDAKTAMQYQHPELEIVRAALDQETAVEKRA